MLGTDDREGNMGERGINKQRENAWEVRGHTPAKT